MIRPLFEQGLYQRFGCHHLPHRHGMNPDNLLTQRRRNGAKTLRPTTPVSRCADATPCQAYDDERHQQVQEECIDSSQGQDDL